MSGDGVDKQRRYFLIGATSVVAGLGIVGAAVPFVRSWSPSAKARALGAPVTVDFSKLQPGEMLGPIPAWRGKPIFIVYRTPDMLKIIESLNTSRADPNSNRDMQPQYAKNEFRSRRPEIGVYVGICTHLGCSPKFDPIIGVQPFDDKWEGGFYCPCHGSTYDLAGRVQKNKPAPDNLQVPPHSFIGDGVVTIGIDEENA